MDELIFLGTAGGRMTVAKQLRASGGFWAVLGGTRVHVDPGPGALVHSRARALKLDPTILDAIVLTHKHLDHAGDANAMIEAMTEGGTKRRGVVLAPRDAYEDDPVILRYIRRYADKTEVLVEGGTHQIGVVRVETPLRLKHPVETYGLRLLAPSLTVSLIACTGYFPALEEAYAGDVLILNVVFLPRRDDSHLCLEDAQRLIGAIRPRLAILTHFGMTMVRGKPWELAEQVSRQVLRWRCPPSRMNPGSAIRHLTGEVQGGHHAQRRDR